MTWNIESIKSHIYVLCGILTDKRPDLVFISEPQIFQSDISETMSCLKGEYVFHLNSDDLHDPELALIKSRAVGGTLVMWRKWIDPYVTIHHVTTNSFLPLVLNLPGAAISIHICIYLPTSGKEAEFLSELVNLRNCIENLLELYNDPIIYIRGDGNTNKKNKTRSSLLKHFCDTFSLASVNVNHRTYHHFTGEGKFDSDIDILLHSTQPSVTESVTEVICKLDHPEIQSHHDAILSLFDIPAKDPPPISEGLVSAPRVDMPREKILWSDEGKELYQSTVSNLLPGLRERWLQPDSKSSTSILLQCTNSLLAMSAAATNKSVHLAKKPEKSAKPPKMVKRAQNRLNKAHRHLKSAKQSGVLPASLCQKRSVLSACKKVYRESVRRARLDRSLHRDSQLHQILTSNPSKVYGFIRSCRQTSSSKIQKLTVGEKTYLGSSVADGFYESMTSLKTCDPNTLQNDVNLTESLSNYQHILRICQDHHNVPLVTPVKAASILKRMKKNVTDLFSITVLHYTHAGKEGLDHFVSLLNAIITEVNNATIKELNMAYGLILYKGHNKEKTSDRAYRTISSCPVLAKALDLYLRDLYQDVWDSHTAPTQYQTTGSSHELASLLVTEVAQYSLNVMDKPVYLLVLDAQSAFDRCLRQILCNELYKAGLSGSALLLIDNRLANRSTTYDWDGTLMGPAHDGTGFEQGGINSGDYYKLYNNEQLNSAQDSHLGVNIGSSTVSAIGQADDVILATNSIQDLQLLAQLTESYCARYRVKLVPSKTKLLPLSTKNHHFLVEYARLINPVTINGEVVKFVTEAEHVGVVRSTAGNMPNLANRIAAHKKALGSVCSAGMARSHRANPAASLRAQHLYGTSVLFSGLASLVLSSAEVNVLETYFKNTLQNIQKLHQNTPRSLVYFLAGSLPAQAILHRRQLSLFSMICRLPTDPLNIHARYILTTAFPSAKSWFQQIRDICLQYQLPHPLHLLDNPPDKNNFKKLVKLKVAEHWQSVLRSEAAPLTSLKYFNPNFFSLLAPHQTWLSAGSNPFESSKSMVVAKMLSGRYRTEQLCRFWSFNRSGNCVFPTCQDIPGDLEHLLVVCPALEPTRAGLRTMWQERTYQNPALFSLVTRILASSAEVQVQFILDPCVFPEIITLGQVFGQTLVDHVLYLTRTYAYYLHRRKLILTDKWPLQNPKKSKKFPPQMTDTSHQANNNMSNYLLFTGSSPADTRSQPEKTTLQYSSTATDASAVIATRPSLDLPPKPLIAKQDIVPERSCLAPAVCMTLPTRSLAPCYQPLRHQFAGPKDVPDLGCVGAVGSVGAVAQQFKTGTITSTSV